MSFIDPNAFYQEELLLLDKNLDAPTTITEGQVEDGDLQPFRHRLELTNTGNQLQNNGILTLRIPPDGTFVRKEPILIDESAKDDYIIQVRLKQDRDKDGIYETEGRLFRFKIGQPTLQDDAVTGETLKINLISLEYATRETLDAERFTFPFKTPQEAFEVRVINYNLIKGLDNVQLIAPSTPTPTINFTDGSPQEWRPLAPTPTHDLLRQIITRQAQAGVAGGSFKDYFFDYEPLTISTKTVVIKAEEEGTINRGVILNPLIFDFVSDTEKDKTINVDLIKFKNNVIMEGNPLGGTLPMEHARFASTWEHAKERPEWDSTTQYFDGTAGTNQSEIRITDDVLNTIRFFKAVVTTGNININPITHPSAPTFWFEDFVIIPPWSVYAEFEEDDIVTTIDSGFYRFWRANTTIPYGGLPPSPASTVWDDILRDIPTSARESFFSYTPWTADFQAMRAGTLFGISDETQEDNFEEAGYQGVVPDWNFIRNNFDRVQADDRFQLVAGKDVIKTLDDKPIFKERYTGARYLVSASPSGVFSGQANRIAEYIGDDYDQNANSVSSWRFSDFPKNNEVICHQGRGVMLIWSDDTDQWEDFWNILDIASGGVNTTIKKLLFDGTRAVTFLALGPIIGTLIGYLHDIQEFGSATRQSPLHICKDIKLVRGATGIPAQAFELRFDWNPFESHPNGDKKNYSSIGAWWYMPFPYPKIPTFGRDVGDVYKNPVIDTNNLTLNHKGKRGWNNGIDSEDLGRIQTIAFKPRLSLFGSFSGGLALGFADLPMICWAVDIFDRVWFSPFKIRRNGQFDTFHLSFGENSAGQIHRGRYDEYLKIFGIVLETDWLLEEKQWTGIEFDWRFVKAVGMFYEGSYNNEGLYVASQFPDYVDSIKKQVEGATFPFIASQLLPGESYNADDFLVNNARLAIDELRFEKQLYANSDDEHIPDARTVLDHEASEVDYLNLKVLAQASRERRKFVEQAWFIQANGDVRLRFGEEFIAEGDRVPGGSQELICSEVKHIIDSDGYTMQITGKRKFVFT